MPAFSTSQFHKIVWASALYDVLVTAGFATPWTFILVHHQLSAVNQALGGDALPAFTPFHILLACLLGSVVMTWSVLRLRTPEQRLGRYDGVTRMLFSSWMLWALVETQAPLLWLFLVPEFAWGVLQLWPVRPGAARTIAGQASIGPAFGVESADGVSQRKY